MGNVLSTNNPHKSTINPEIPPEKWKTSYSSILGRTNKRPSISIQFDTESDLLYHKLPTGWIPSGWSNDPKKLLLDYYWRGKGDLAEELQHAYDLPRAKPLLEQRPWFIFECRGKFYFYNMISGGVKEVVKPKDLREFLMVMDSGNRDALKTKDLRSSGERYWRGI